MKTITISTENSETYSSISNFFIDYYMTDANGEFVKVYLYLVRLLSNSSKITVAEIADHFNLTENDICHAIKYWISKDVLKLNYDGRGKLNGIVLLPLHNPDTMLVSQETDIMSILRDDSKEDVSYSNYDKAKDTEAAMVKQPKKTVASIIPMPEITSQNVDLSVPQKPKFSPDALDEKKSDDDWTDIVYQVETIFGKQVSARDVETLLYIYDSLNFNVDLFEYLIEYCATMGKKNCRYMEAVAIAWYKDGIKTRQEAKEQSMLTTGIARTIFKTLGIRYHTLSNIELAYITTWSKDFGFSEDIIKAACERAVINSPNSANYAYINAILENWSKKGVTTLSDVDKLDRQFQQKKQRKDANTSGLKSANGFNNFEQSRLDDELDEMEKLFLKEVNKK